MAIIRQYVNLDPTQSPQLDGLDKARAGTKVPLVAQINPAKAGVNVTFEITRGAENVVRPREMKSFVATTAKDGKAKLDFVVTEHGGDEFLVKAWVLSGPKSARVKHELSSNTYVVWRRIYYQMSRFKAGNPGHGQPRGSLPEIPALDLTDAITEIAARSHNIELVDKTTRELIKHQGTLITSESSSLSYKLAAEEGYNAALEPVTVRIVLIDRLGEKRTESHTEPDIPTDAKGSFEVAATLFKDPTLAKDKDWLVEVAWRFTGTDAFAPLDPRFITSTDDDRMVEVDFPGAALATGGNAGRHVDVRVTYRVVASASNGSSWYNVVCLATREQNDNIRSAADLTKTVTHELGHFLNMVPVGQTTHYIDHGHQGRHCFTGLSEGQIEGALYTGRPGTCVMYGEAGARRLPAFCEACDPSLRASTAQREGMPKKKSDWV
ncbi:MAG: hypothetical protein ABJE95_32870 [Byssovorax sp.]